MEDETHREMKQFEQDFQQPFMQRHGCIHVASAGENFQIEVSHLQVHHQQGKQRGLQCRWLIDGDIKRQLPWLNINHDSLGLFYQGGGHADTYLLST